MTAIVDLPTARMWLRERSIDTGDDPMLQMIIDAAILLVEDIVGPTQPVQYSETYDGGSPTISVLHGPLISVQSITEIVGTTVYTLNAYAAGVSPSSIWGYTLNLPTDTIERRTIGGGPANFTPGQSNILITYTAGFASGAGAPANVRLAVLALVKHIYETTLPRGRAQKYDDGSTPIGIGYAVPNFVLEMLQPSRKMPGIA